MADEYISGYAPYFFYPKGKEAIFVTYEDLETLYDYDAEEIWDIIFSL